MWSGVRQRWNAQLAFIYCGDPNQPSLYTLSGQKRVLTIRTGDGYDNLPAKFILALVYYRQRFGGAVMHVDDDAKKVGPFVPTLTDIDFGGPRIQGAHRRGANLTGHWDKVGPESYWFQRHAPRQNSVGHPFAHGGSGFYLSPHAIELILAQWNETNTDRLYRSEIFDDVMVSDILARHTIFARQISNTGILGDKPEQRDSCGFPCPRNY